MKRVEQPISDKSLWQEAKTEYYGQLHFPKVEAEYNCLIRI